MAVSFKDSSDAVREQLNRNVSAALHAVGVKAVGRTVINMQYGYGRPIRRTGDLMGDVSFEVERSGKGTVDIGNSLEYAPHVHEGTSKMAGRPYLRDALTASENLLKETAAEYLKKGF